MKQFDPPHPVGGGVLMMMRGGQGGCLSGFKQPSHLDAALVWCTAAEPDPVQTWILGKGVDCEGGMKSSGTGLLPWMMPPDVV